MSVPAGPPPELMVAVAVMIAGRPWRRVHSRRLPGERIVSPSTSGARAAADPEPGAVAEWAADLSRELRRGATLTAALRDHVPRDPSTRVATGALRRDLERGADLPTALVTMRDGSAGPDAELVAAVAGACAQVGGPAAEPLDRAAATLRGRAADLEERRAHSAQARLSARVMTLLPIASLAFLAAGDDDIRQVLRSSAGLACLAVGGTANVLGWLWMRRIVTHR